MSTHKLMDMIDTIWDAAETMTTYSADHTSFNENTIRDFAESVVSHHPGSVRSLMNRIHFKISPHDHSKRLPLLYQPGIFDHVLEASKAVSTIIFIKIKSIITPKLQLLEIGQHITLALFNDKN